jgi:hypothetical protein
MAPRNTQVYHIQLNVKDINTQIVLDPYEWYGMASTALRAERMAIRDYKSLALDEWRRKICNEYRLTATQLKRLIKDGIITPPDLVEVTVAKIEPHKGG